MNLESPRIGAASLSEEEAARANVYALIGRLFYGGPDAGLLAEICGADEGVTEGGGPLARIWKRLQDACRNAESAELEQEYAALFISAGRALVSLYVSGYANGMASDKRLVQLRQELEGMGLARQDAVFEVEDHISGLCDVMRFLIESNQPIVAQKRFFEEFIHPGALALCDAVESAEPSDFYKVVAQFARLFIELEKSAFAMEA